MKSAIFLALSLMLKTPEAYLQDSIRGKMDIWQEYEAIQESQKLDEHETITSYFGGNSAIIVSNIDAQDNSIDGLTYYLMSEDNENFEMVMYYEQNGGLLQIRQLWLPAIKFETRSLEKMLESGADDEGIRKGLFYLIDGGHIPDEIKDNLDTILLQSLSRWLNYQEGIYDNNMEFELERSKFDSVVDCVYHLMIEPHLKGKINK